MPKFAGYPSSSSPEDHSAPTPYTGSAQTIEYTELLQRRSAQAEAQPLRYLRARTVVEQALSAVDRARNEGADWDDEPGQAVPFATAKRAKELLIEAALRAEGEGRNWANPTVSATPEGGIHFSWLVSGSRVAVTVFAPYEHTICVSKFPGAASRREMVSDYGAVSRILQVFETYPAASANASF